MFRTAVLRLTFWYLLIIMLLSGAFSLALYRVSTSELDRTQSQLEPLLERSFFLGRQSINFEAFTRERLQQIEDSRERIQLNLLYFNFIILLGGGAASLFLAQRTLQPIEESMEAQARFTSDASHELRTPLTAIRSEIEVALRDPKLSLSESKQLHHSTLEEVSRLVALSSGLLKLTKHEGKELKASFTKVSVAEVLATVERHSAVLAQQKSIELELAPTSATAWGDAWSITEIISILVENAIKYSPAESTVRIRTTVRPTSIAIEVRDQGSGIPEADLPHIFDRFYRADTARTNSATAGYGLGLAIAHQLTKLHRGTLEVSSEVGSGSTFTLILPKPTLTR